MVKDHMYIYSDPSACRITTYCLFRLLGQNLPASDPRHPPPLALLLTGHSQLVNRDSVVTQGQLRGRMWRLATRGVPGSSDERVCAPRRPILPHSGKHTPVAVTVARAGACYDTRSRQVGFVTVRRSQAITVSPKSKVQSPSFGKSKRWVITECRFSRLACPCP